MTSPVDLGDSPQHPETEQMSGSEPARWDPTPGPKTLVAVTLGAIGLDMAVQHPVGLATALALGLMVVGSFVGGWGARSKPQWMLAATAGPIVMLVVRESPWMVTLNVLAVLGLLVLAAVVRDEPAPMGSALGRLIRPLPALGPAAWSVDLIAKSAAVTVPIRPGLSDRARPILRAIALALPVVVVLMWLLASSDALFRSIFYVSIEIPDIGEHLWFLLIGASFSAMVAGHASWSEPPERVLPSRILGPADLLMILGGIAAVYAVFVATQLVAITAGSDYVLRTTGLTYAEYARAGFFQLLAAAVMTLAILLLLERYRSPDSSDHRSVLALQQATVALTLVVVAVAIRRLFLYESEFGLTMLRFSTIVFAAWIGVVFIACGMKLAGRLRPEFASVVLSTAFFFLIAVNAANPEALVASRNIDRFGGTDELDITYLINDLGDDALPAILDDPNAEAQACRFLPRPDDRTVVFNFGRSRAASAYDEHCG